MNLSDKSAIVQQAITLRGKFLAVKECHNLQLSITIL